MKENRNRNNQLKIWLTHKEREAFENVFKLSGFKNRNDFIMSNIYKTTIFKYDMSIFKDIKFNLGKMGSNINQISRRLNTNDVYYREDIEELKLMNEKINQIITELNEIKNLFPGGV